MRIPPCVLLVNKPQGPSTFDVIRVIKRKLPKKFGKIGHFGTLDPFADGLVIVGLNGGQKLTSVVHDSFTKTYRAVGVFGKKTLSGDIEKEVIETNSDVELEKLKHVDFSAELNTFVGEYWQSPHAFSASKHQGKALYEWALQGKLIEKEKVKREIKSVKLIEFQFPLLTFEIEVSSGTYVRSFFEDFSAHFGLFGHLQSLSRIAIGPHDWKQALSLDEISQLELSAILDQRMGLDHFLKLESIQLTSDDELKFRNGQVQFIKHYISFEKEQLAWVKNLVGEVLGLIRISDASCSILFNLSEFVK